MEFLFYLCRSTQEYHWPPTLLFAATSRPILALLFVGPILDLSFWTLETLRPALNREILLILLIVCLPVQVMRICISQTPSSIKTMADTYLYGSRHAMIAIIQPRAVGFVQVLIALPWAVGRCPILLTSTLKRICILVCLVLLPWHYA